MLVQYVQKQKYHLKNQSESDIRRLLSKLNRGVQIFQGIRGINL